MDRKFFTVFVSSTYRDLKRERQEAAKAILKSNCIPLGMEFFVASPSSLEDIITQYLKDTDYYLLIVGNRFGSIKEDNVSYTQFEYRIAKELKIPIIVHFISKRTKCDNEKDLDNFRNEIKNDGCNIDYCNSKDKLCLNIVASLSGVKETHPRPGWRRITNDKSSSHFNQQTSDVFSQGNDYFDIKYTAEYRLKKELPQKFVITRKFDSTIKMNWNDIFDSIDLKLPNEVIEHYNLFEEIKEVIKNSFMNNIDQQPKEDEHLVIFISSESEKKIILQLLALDLIKDNRYGTYVLTEYGISKFLKSKAIKKL